MNFIYSEVQSLSENLAIYAKFHLNILCQINTRNKEINYYVCFFLFTKICSTAHSESKLQLLNIKFM